MAQRRPPIDIRELQMSMLQEDLREEQDGGARSAQRPAQHRAGPPRHYGRGDGRGDGRERFAPGPSDAVRGRDIDVHELMKREAFAAPQAACDDHFEKNRPCPSDVYGISDQYIVLDTFLKLRESLVERGEFRWNFMVQGVTGDEVLGVRDKIDTVIEIQIGAFCMPSLPEVPYVLEAAPLAPTGTDRLVLIHNNNNGAAGPPTLVANNNAAGLGQYPHEVLVPTAAVPLPTTLTPWVNNPYSQLPNGARFTVQIREAGLQSYSDRNGARHHYEFTTALPVGVGMNPNMMLALPQSGSQWDTFIFTDPLKDVHGLTLVFRNPDTPIRFLPDCLYDVDAESGGAAPGPYLRFRSPGHGLSMGDRVFVTGFKSGNSKLDAFVNRPEGLVAAGDPAAAPLLPGQPIASVTFWTDPAISIVDLTVQVPVLPQTATVCIAKRRMRIPIRLRRVVGRLTNYIAP